MIILPNCMYTMKLCQQTEARNLEEVFGLLGVSCGGFFLGFGLVFFKEKKMVVLGFIAISLQPLWAVFE